MWRQSQKSDGLYEDGNQGLEPIRWYAWNQGGGALNAARCLLFLAVLSRDPNYGTLLPDASLYHQIQVGVFPPRATRYPPALAAHASGCDIFSAELSRHILSCRRTVVVSPFRERYCSCQRRSIGWVRFSFGLLTLFIPLAGMRRNIHDGARSQNGGSCSATQSWYARAFP